VSAAPQQKEDPMARDRARDTMGGGDLGAHLGSEVGRGLTGGDLPTDAHASQGHGRTSTSQGRLERDDMTRETAGDDAGLRTVGPGIISDEPAVLGMGAGDPGYTAEEDDDGDGRPGDATRTAGAGRSRRPGAAARTRRARS
jgi:hypothetical protein